MVKVVNFVCRSGKDGLFLQRCYLWFYIILILGFVNLSNLLRLINYILLFFYNYYLLIRVFHISVSRLSFTEVWVTASLLKSPGLFSVFWPFSIMVSTRLPTSKSSSPFSNPLVTVPNAPITIGIIVICMFHSIFNSLARSRYLSFFSHSFSYILWSAGTAKSTILQFLLFFFCWLLLGLVFWPRLGDQCVYQSPIGVYVCYFLGQVLGCTYTICWYGQI